MLHTKNPKREAYIIVMYVLCVARESITFSYFVFFSSLSQFKRRELSYSLFSVFVIFIALAQVKHTNKNDKRRIW
jgi:heme/copper-type cytochrome/quinol oxidase subunit 4